VIQCGEAVLLAASLHLLQLALIEL
jgi:hypothetical protein